MALKPYTVELSVTAIVMAESDIDAHTAAIDYARDIWNEIDPDVDVHGEIKSIDRLPADWTPDSLPYGGDGETQLKDLVPAEEVTPDTQTIDMFAALEA